MDVSVWLFGRQEILGTRSKYTSWVGDGDCWVKPIKWYKYEWIETECQNGSVLIPCHLDDIEWNGKRYNIFLIKSMKKTVRKENSSFNGEMPNHGVT